MQLPRRWEKVESKGQIYSPRTGHAVCVKGEKLYLFGGADALSRCNDVFEYDFCKQQPDSLVTKVWRYVETKTEKPIERSGAKAEVHNGQIYFFGGYTKKDGEYFDDIFSLSLSSLVWTHYDVKQKPDERTDHSLVLYKDALYAYGGRIEVMIRRDMIKFDLRTKEWSRVGGAAAATNLETPPARFGHSAVVNDGIMYVFGGWDGHFTLNHLLAFDLINETWRPEIETSGDIPARYRHSSVTTPDAMYIFGGIDHTQQRFNDVYELNYKTMTWTRLVTIGDAPSKRTFHQAAFFEGYMYIMGGFDGIKRNDVYRILIDEKFSPKNSSSSVGGAAAVTSSGNAIEIEAEPALNDHKHELTNEYFNNILLQHWYRLENHGKVFTGRTGHEALIWKKNIYVFGGTDDNAKLSDLYVYGVYKNEWEKVVTNGTAPCPRSGAKGVAYKNALYFFGGYEKKHGIYYNDIYKYDIGKNEWSQLNTTPAASTQYGVSNKPAARTDHTCVLYQKAIYIFGGYDGNRRFNDLYRFDLETYEWSKIEGDGDLPGDRFGHSAVVYDHSMYIFGGWNGHETLNDIYQYSFASNYWFWLRRIRGDLPASRYRHAAVVLNDKMYLFGGVDTHQTRYNDLIQYEFASRHWKIVETTGTNTPIPRTFHRAVIYKDILYIIGGYGGKRLNDMHHIALPYDDFTEEESESVLNTKRPSSSTGSSISESQPEIEENVRLNTDIPKLQQQICLLIKQVRELSLRLKTEEERDFCKICYDREIDVVFLECGHRVTCLKCSSSLETCPVCRLPISRTIKTFTV